MVMDDDFKGIRFWEMSMGRQKASDCQGHLQQIQLLQALKAEVIHSRAQLGPMP